ncbi:hypothetical protein [Micromonospora sp. WMMD987]|uniref:hypothetical protein n=1 Tax=Micromonospora TaxID=1873 RepID=UPI00249ADAF1|nr:hypothetical protein [Micromonospora sp. WMMD987]WFE97117.1 hypothetical protein O7612_09710 [Micromonospora sp. WMMD987]
MIPNRIGRRRVVATGMALALVATAVGVPRVPAAQAAPPRATAQAATSQVVGFTVGRDGRFYLASATGVTPFGSTVVAPPNADVSAVRQPDGNAAVFTVGTQGGLVAAVTSSATSTVSVYRDGASNLATPGTRLTAFTAPDGYVYVFFVGVDGAVYGTSYNRVVRPGTGPQRLSATGVAPPGAVLAGSWRSGGPGAFFVGSDGGLRHLGRTNGSWQTSSIGPSGVAAAGSGVAALTDGDVQAYYAGLDGRLWQVTPAGGGLPDPWNRVAVSATGVVPVGARLTVTRPANGPTGVFFADAAGAVRIVTNLAGGWQDSVTTGPGVASPGGPISALTSGDYFFVGWWGNGLWWWLFWWWRRPPPPPPPPPLLGETLPITLGYPIQYGANVSLILYR